MATRRGSTTRAQTKRQKVNLTQKKLVWEWEDDEHNWKPYTTTISDKISDALKAGQTDLSIVVGKTTFKIDFGDMVQKNIRTSRERRIRLRDNHDYDCSLEDWEWLDDKNHWKKFTHGQNELFFAAKQLGMQSVKFRYLGNEYEIDRVNMKQKNIGTNRSRKVKIASYSTVYTSGNQSPAGIPVSPEPNNSETHRGSEQATRVKALTFKGKAPVDEECPSSSKYHVYMEDGEPWDAMLNQTNLKNNNNKFYLLQLLEGNTSKSYSVWFRWGRVGKTGQNNLVPFHGNLQDAKDTFTKKFYDKTLNEWEHKSNFEKNPGKYDLIKMDYGTNARNLDVSDGTSVESRKLPESLLDARVKRVMEIICNVQAMEEVVLEMKYDAKKAPLGKLTKDQISAGYEALKKIESCIKSGKTMEDKLIKACDEFYTRIPHCFGMRRPPIIRCREDVVAKLELLEALGDIEIAMKVLSENEDVKLHPIDRHYKALNCELSLVSHDSEEFQIIEQYLQNTHAPTHSHYKMEVEEVFTCRSEDQERMFRDCGNRYLLWHGSRLSNWVGILKQGLRIAPPEAPVTGYMFGKGIYFADMSSKSANYCFATQRKNVGFLLLSEVSLGKQRELIGADYEADKLPSGYHSVKGLGKMAPPTSLNHTMSDGVIVPVGKAKSTGVCNKGGYTLNYNEYIVYNTNQVKSRFLIQVKFHFT